MSNIISDDVIQHTVACMRMHYKNHDLLNILCESLCIWAQKKNLALAILRCGGLEVVAVIIRRYTYDSVLPYQILRLVHIMCVHNNSHIFVQRFIELGFVEAICAYMSHNSGNSTHMDNGNRILRLLLVDNKYTKESKYSRTRVLFAFACASIHRLVHATRIGQLSNDLITSILKYANIQEPASILYKHGGMNLLTKCISDPQLHVCDSNILFILSKLSHDSQTHDEIINTPLISYIIRMSLIPDRIDCKRKASEILRYLRSFEINKVRLKLFTAAYTSKLAEINPPTMLREYVHDTNSNSSSDNFQSENEDSDIHTYQENIFDTREDNMCSNTELCYHMK